jgi:hypothetical protein
MNNLKHLRVKNLIEICKCLLYYSATSFAIKFLLFWNFLGSLAENKSSIQKRTLAYKDHFTLSGHLLTWCYYLIHDAPFSLCYLRLSLFPFCTKAYKIDFSYIHFLYICFTCAYNNKSFQTLIILSRISHTFDLTNDFYNVNFH